MREAVVLLPTPDATQVFGLALGRLLQSGDVIALIGDLGSGKTTLTRAIGAGAGALDDVTSPTFTLVHEYRGPVPLFHMDPYRLERPEYLLDLGFDEYLDRDGALVVEWADRVEPLLPEDRLTIRIEMMTGDASALDERERDLSVCLTMGEQGGNVEGNNGAPSSNGAGGAYRENETRRLTVVAEGKRHEQLLATLLQDPGVTAMIWREPTC